MDRETTDLTSDEFAVAAAPGSPTIVSVCITCKTADGVLVGPDMFDAISAAIASSDQVKVRQVQCLSVCKRPATVSDEPKANATGKFPGRRLMATTRKPGDLPSRTVLWRRRGGVHLMGPSLTAIAAVARDLTKLVA